MSYRKVRTLRTSDPDSAERAVRSKPSPFFLLHIYRTTQKLAAQLDDGKGLAKTVADVKDANKRGALHFAAREGKTEVCKYLLEELKLDVDTKDEDGRYGRFGTVTTAIAVATADTPVNLNHTAKAVVMGGGETALLHAARQGHTTTAKYLIECGANPAIPSELGATTLHHSAGIGDIELLRFLISKGVGVDSQSDAGTPLIWAAGHGQPDSVRVLLENHADPNAETDDNITPLLSSVAAGSLACLELLIQCLEFVDLHRDDFFITMRLPLLGVVLLCLPFYGSCANVAGAKVNVTAGGATPLHIAADNGSPEIIKCLLKAGSDPNVTDEDGLKPVQVAAARGNRTAVEILFPLTSQIQTVPEWTVDGILEHTQSETGKEQEEKKEIKLQRDAITPKQDMVEVTPEAKKKAAEAKLRGNDAFKQKDYLMAVDAYTQVFNRLWDLSCTKWGREWEWVNATGKRGNETRVSGNVSRGSSMENSEKDKKEKEKKIEWIIQNLLSLPSHEPFLMAASGWMVAIDFDPTDATLLSNRSLCWICLGQAEHALNDAKACRALRPDWPKACYREGAALPNSFYEGVTLDPENKALVDAFREAVEAGRKFHGTDQQKS
ncbi:hypothetical protein TEA_002666 [Camellia sinensis var. sinensis]|uniref:Uncharacterized protein n=1 Tax=Camellia sinensis var. sinensis TaxID=542762 RepID=A0A4S4F0R9_CAMSN|nr:hypothetical protein TEA_002666 [Camellia sinensis var. sinensis]